MKTSEKIQFAAEETKRQIRVGEIKNKSDFVDSVGWVLSATGIEIDLAEWRIACGLRPHRD